MKHKKVFFPLTCSVKFTVSSAKIEHWWRITESLLALLHECGVKCRGISFCEPTQKTLKTYELKFLLNRSLQDLLSFPLWVKLSSSWKAEFEQLSPLDNTTFPFSKAILSSLDNFGHTVLSKSNASEKHKFRSLFSRCFFESSRENSALGMIIR